MSTASRVRIVGAAILIVVAGTAIGALGIRFSGLDVTDQPSSPVVDDATTKILIDEFCVACHMVPSPSHLPRRLWPNEITKAFNRYQDSGRDDLKIPDKSIITEYFSRMAPDVVKVPDLPESTPSPLKFRTEIFDLPASVNSAAVSFLNIVPSAKKSCVSDLLLCGMENGGLNRFSWRGGKMSTIELGRLKDPDHIVACDFDRDGNQDYLVAELGMLKPTDELLGSVVLLRSTGEGGLYETITILDGVGRVADAQIADLDGDGDNDFVVAEFGYEKVGQLIWLETLSITNGHPQTSLHVIDPRHGSIHTPITDLDGDGDLDLVVLISQEHEAIVAFLNDGLGHFEQRVLFKADTPSFGSSGLELIDLDGDGDLDVLFTNGDTLDTLQIQPFHGVNCLENQGSLHFKYRQIAVLPAAMRAVAGDIDGDGDADIAAVAFCPPLMRYQIEPRALDTIILLEQTNPLQFQRHTLERSLMNQPATVAGYMAVAAGDFDGDLDLDLAVGEFSPFDSNTRRWFRIYWNQLTSGESKVPNN